MNPDFLDRLLEKRPPPAAPTIEKPPWLEKFLVSGENDELTLLAQLGAKKREIETQIKEAQARSQEYAWTKELFYSDGEQFVRAVQRALQRFGIQALPGPPKLADLLARFGDTVLAFEVKGSDGAAKGWINQQCSRWVNETRSAAQVPDSEQDSQLRMYAEILRELGIGTGGEGAEVAIRVKGIIIANTYRKLSLDQRVGQDFPGTLAAMIRASQHIALTGLQLFCVLADDLRKPGEGRKRFEELISKSGVYDQFRDWSKSIVSVGK